MDPSKRLFPFLPPTRFDQLIGAIEEPMVRHLAGWRFMPMPSLDDRCDLVYHRDEALTEAGRIALRAEYLIRYASGVVVVLVKGRIDHPDHAPLLLRRWHRVERVGEPFSPGLEASSDGENR